MPILALMRYFVWMWIVVGFYENHEDPVVATKVVALRSTDSLHSSYLHKYGVFSTLGLSLLMVEFVTMSNLSLLLIISHSNQLIELLFCKDQQSNLTVADYILVLVCRY